ncbi:hypothetical protein CDES_04690 [Corynebacterium deserti GIMN1.010]|uniref:ABC transporter domain-containing protein n=1 Tax=Corynebacterium deserti GIMN1.010 TaxID=931089 RepID=A0A0M4CX01_9CORY|nr:hypothetical protein [Corynebacterium deserti]ALC05382.1 hypothetical protein CDES_04690 [Corynebacterium deserti GIMN1.010]
MTQGSVEFGGVDVRELRDLRRHIAMMSQETYCFRGTVLDNIRPGFPDTFRDEGGARVI